MDSKSKTLVVLLIFGLALLWGGFNVKPAKASYNWPKDFVTNWNFESSDHSTWYQMYSPPPFTDEVECDCIIVPNHGVDSSSGGWLGGDDVYKYALLYPHSTLSHVGVGSLADADRVVLSYYYNMTTAEIANNDKVDVVVRDAASYGPLGIRTYNSFDDKTSGWVMTSWDITAYKNYDLYFYFMFTPTDNSAITTFNVDNVSLTAYYDDSTGPVSGSVVINSMNTATTSIGVTLSTSATDSKSGVKFMRFSNDNSNWSGWYDYASSYPWTLTAGQGTKTVYAQYRDNVGNISGSASDSIVYDPNGPSGKIKINKGARSTTKAKVRLGLSASDLSGVSQMRFSNNGKRWSSWKTYAKTYRNWDMTKRSYGGSSKRGKKKVYVQFKDTLGNVSTKKLDTITYR